MPKFVLSRTLFPVNSLLAAVRIDFDLISAETEYIFFDFWNNRWLNPLAVLLDDCWPCRNLFSLPQEKLTGQRVWIFHDVRSPSRFYPRSTLSFCRVPERLGGHMWWKRGGSGRRNEDDGRFDASTLRCRFPFAQQPALLRWHQRNRFGARQPFVRGGQGENGSKGSRRTWAIGLARRSGETPKEI